MPSKETTIEWKAYQTYKDGSVVAWIHTSTGNQNDDNTNPPFSTTQVINYLKEGTNEQDSDLPVQINFLVFLSLLAFALSVISIYLTTKKMYKK